MNSKCPSENYFKKNNIIALPRNTTKGDDCLITIKVNETTPTFISLMLSDIVISSGGKIQIFDGEVNKDNMLFDITGSSGQFFFCLFIFLNFILYLLMGGWTYTLV